MIRGGERAEGTRALECAGDGKKGLQAVSFRFAPSSPRGVDVEGETLAALLARGEVVSEPGDPIDGLKTAI